MRPILSLDCETDPFKRGRIPKPFLWGISDGSSYHEIQDTHDVVDFCRDTPGVFYAHNGGRFDYHFMLDAADEYSDVLIINGRLAKWKLGKAELRDSFNILPVPLKEYKKDDFDYTLMELENRDKPAVREKIREYLKHDCQYLNELVNGFCDEFGLHLTQAGASMRLWKKMSGYEVPETDWKFYDTLKPFYYGGRVQCFRTGVQRFKFRIADVKSAYPRAMLEDHPIGDKLIEKKDRYVVPQRFYTVRCRANGCFPLRGDDGRLHYFSDNTLRVFNVTGWELIAANELKLLKDVEIINCLAVNKTINFKEFIGDLWDKRKQAENNGDAARKLFYKLMMNGLYGKFGADPRRYFNHFIMESRNAPMNDTRYELAGYVGKWAVMRDNEQDNFSRFYCVATSASITGYQRAVMMRQLARCCDPLYCDTDSIAAADFGEINEGSELGQWEIEKAPYIWYAIGGRKLYAFEKEKGYYSKPEERYKKASKGTKLTVKQIIDVARGDQVLFEPDIPTFSLFRPVQFVDRNVSFLED